MIAWLRRVAARARMRAHEAEERRARAALVAARGDAFDAARERYLELHLCVDPLTCDHLRRR